MRLPFRIPPRDGQAFDVVGLGLNSIDLIAVVAEHPAPNSKQRMQRFAKLAGGPVATALVACTRFGWRARYIGRFGDDDLGALARESLIAEGVDISATSIAPGASNQFSIILVDARSGSRTVLWDRHPGLVLEAADVPADAVRSGRLLLLDCQDTLASAEAARQARAAGIPTILDVEKVRPAIGELLHATDAIITAETFPSELTGHEDPGRALEAMAREFNSPLVCVTLGAKGSLARCNGREIRTEGFAIDCVDSTGAGDVFRGAFASACLRWPDGEVEDALTYANAAAALNCRGLGARGALPTAAEVDRVTSASRSGLTDL
jgi:sulfofructose kinase